MEPALDEPRDAVHDLDLHRAQRVAPVAHPGRAHRVGDEGDPARAGAAERQLQHGRVQVGAVVDQLDGDPLVLQEGGDRAGRRGGAGRGMALNRWVATLAPASTASSGRLVGRVGVPDGGDDAVVGEQPYGVQPAGQFGGERHHPRGAAGGVDQLADVRGVGVAQQRRVVGAAAAARDERALEVDAGEVALLDELGERRGLPGEVVRGRR